MKNYIWKYDIQILDRFLVTMPEGAEVIHVDVQHGTPRMWVKCDPLKPDENRAFRIIGTGHEFDDSELLFIKSFFTEGGLYVWHLFEERRGQ